MGAINGNLSTMFGDVNEKVCTIAAEVGQTPQGWDAGIFNMVQTLSENVIVPIVRFVITYVLHGANQHSNGLALCRMIITSQGGTVTAKKPSPGRSGLHHPLSNVTEQSDGSLTEKSPECELNAL